LCPAARHTTAKLGLPGGVTYLGSLEAFQERPIQIRV
jgi:hypothetical protein